MNIPNLPTDNMYKFDALLGFFLMVMGFLYTFFNLQKMKLKIAEESTWFNIFIKNLEYFEIDFDREVKLFNKLESKKLLTKFELNQLTELGKRIEAQKKQIRLAEIELIERKKFGSDLAHQLKDLKMLVLPIVLVGVFLYLFGSIRWYSRLQKYEDIIIKGKAEEYLRKK